MQCPMPILPQPFSPKKSPLMKLRIGIAALGMVLLCSILAFHFIAGYDWIDAVWMVVITISTVGYGESSEAELTTKLVAIFVIVLGVSATAYTFSGVIQLILQGELDGIVGRRRMERELSRLKNHTIVCGFGRIGRVLTEQLNSLDLAFVILENDPQKAEAAQEMGYLVIEADSTEEECLRRAKINDASQIVVSLSSDVDNVFVTLTARNMCPSIKIIAQAARESSFKKLSQAGANEVVRGHQMVAQHMARLITRPSTANLVALLIEHEHLDFELDELKVPAGNSMIDYSIAQLDIRDNYDLLVVAINPDGGELVFNPPASRKFRGGDTILIMGKADAIDRFRQDKGLLI